MMLREISRIRETGSEGGRGSFRSGLGRAESREGRRRASPGGEHLSIEQEEEQMQRPVRLQPLGVLEVCKEADVAGAQQVGGGQ